MKKSLFALAVLAASLVMAAPAGKAGRGTLLLTFDDRHWARWVKVMPLFEKYNAKASFFPHGNLGPYQLKELKKLHDAGHTVGPHTVNHRIASKEVKKRGFDAYWNDEVEPQMKAFASVGIKPVAMAYPNNASSAATVEGFVKRGITRQRGGVPGARPHDPKGKKRDTLVSFEKLDGMYMNETDVATNALMRGVGIGPYYNTDIEDLKKGIRRAAANNETMILYSHDIADKPTGIGMKTVWLEEILKTASAEGMAIIGFNDLPPLKTTIK